MKLQSSFIFYGFVAVCAFLLNFLWEYAHLPLYKDYEALGSGIQLVVWASAGDMLYVLFAVLFVALLKRKLLWTKDAKTPEYILLAVYGFCIALFVELKALALHRWAYTAMMPTLFGVGLSPLVQMTLLLPLSAYIAQRCEKFLTAR